MIELESKLASLSVNSASCDAKLVDLTLSNKNLADKLATLYSDMSEMKVRLARLHSVNVQLDTVVSKLNSRLDIELTSSSSESIDHVNYMQLRFKETAATVIKQLGQVGYNKRVNIRRAFDYLFDKMKEFIEKIQRFDVIERVQVIALGQDFIFDAMAMIATLLEPLITDPTWPSNLIHYQLQVIYYDANRLLFDGVLRRGNGTTLNQIDDDDDDDIVTPVRHDMINYIDQREVSILNVIGLVSNTLRSTIYLRRKFLQVCKTKLNSQIRY